ncbi:MAG: hypothetical protein HLX51_01625 [Micrococcaceae bacterium]|nr:hypothetical protein [Micrococcaceae bacterium]
MEERKQTMMSSNDPSPDDRLENMLARYGVKPNGTSPTPVPAEDQLSQDVQPLSRREIKNRQSIDRNEDMEDQSFWNRAKRYALPAVLVLGVLLSLFTNLF